MKKRNPQLIIPFSEEFEKIWDIWKEYKWASHKFKYKSVFSEQAALEQVVTLSEGNEEKAIKIIKQSMRREWQGLFPLHETTTGDGKSKKQSNPKKGEAGTGESLTERVIRVANQKFNGGGSGNDGPNLKAV